MKTLTIKPTDTRHLILASLGVLAIAFSDLMTFSVPRIDDLLNHAEVVSIGSDDQHEGQVTPICTDVNEQRRRQSVCNGRKEERHGASVVKAG